MITKTLSFNPLWKLLIDKGLTKNQLQQLSGVSPATIAKLGRGDNVTTDVLLRLAIALDCKVEELFVTVDG